MSRKETDKPYIVCGGVNGRPVVFGWCSEEPMPGQPVRIHDARMVLRWPTACGGLFGLSQNGPKPGCRITTTVPVVWDTCRQALTVSDGAAAKLVRWPDAE